MTIVYPVFCLRRLQIMIASGEWGKARRDLGFGSQRYYSTWSSQGTGKRKTTGSFKVRATSFHSETNLEIRRDPDQDKAVTRDDCLKKKKKILFPLTALVFSALTCISEMKKAF